MVDDGIVMLAAGRLEMQLSPSIGGSISALLWDGERPLLRASNSARQNVLEAASFPLVPFVNRIRGGQFSFRGREIRLAPNMASDPSPLHGQGWQSAWDVARMVEAKRLRSRYRETALRRCLTEQRLCFPTFSRTL